MLSIRQLAPTTSIRTSTTKADNTATLRETKRYLQAADFKRAQLKQNVSLGRLGCQRCDAFGSVQHANSLSVYGSGRGADECA
eukprot:scaffold221156_cov39-Prasinocladus_malaysianus.AAC.1